MNYEECSNLEINRLVAEETGGYIGDVGDYMKDGVKRKVGTLGYQEFDPCNNPNDAWSIIVENKINIEWRDSIKLKPMARGTGGCQEHHADKNPLRAAMICFLKMKDSEK